MTNDDAYIEKPHKGQQASTGAVRAMHTHLKNWMEAEMRTTHVIKKAHKGQQASTGAVKAMHTHRKDWMEAEIDAHVHPTRIRRGVM